MIEKYYAIRWKNGNTAIKHGTWEKVSKSVLKQPGVTFKGFIEKEKAEDWLQIKSAPFRDKDTPFMKDKIYMFVDGSFSEKRQVAGWGWVAIMNGQIISQDNGVLTLETSDLSSRNVCGEIKAAVEAMKWFSTSGLPTPGIIVADYLGIINWAMGFWKYSSAIARQYVHEVQPFLNIIEFEKCDGHSGTVWNEYADVLTRKGYEK